MSPGLAPDPARVMASLPMAVVLVAPDLTIADLNPAAEQALGRSAARLRSLPLQGILAFEESAIREHLTQGEAQLVARGTAVRIEGRQRRLDVMLGPVADHPGWRMLVLNEPIGLEALGGGVADAVPLRAPEILAHEIKNPLAGIRGAAQLLARGADEPGRELTTLITAEVDRVSALIDQMQVLSRKTAARARPCNVHEALRRAMAVLDPEGKGPPRVDEAFDPSLPPVLCSPDALVQVVLNLLDNARAACASNADPRVIVSTRFASGIRLHEAGGTPLALPIEVRISDNGAGVAADLGDHIFEPFVSDKPRGQGLGLALVGKLVREMRGRVTFDRDEAGGWTHFRVHLPVAEAGDFAATAAAA